MTCWGRAGVEILNRLDRESSSENVTWAKGRAVVDEVREAWNRDLGPCSSAEALDFYSPSENGSTAVFWECETRSLVCVLSR